MESTTPLEEGMPVYYVVQHESRRQLPVTPEVLRQAQLYKYDTLTTPITTPLFHSRVLALLANHLSDLKDAHNDDKPTPTIPSLSPADTPLTPSDRVLQLVGYASPWIDLSSPDPVVYDISRQVLNLEISYAAFCGFRDVVIPGPKLQYGTSHGEGIAQYAYAVQEALALSNYTQILIQLPMMYHPDQDNEDRVEGALAKLARPEYVEPGAKSKHDFLGTWDAWHIIRTVCKYNNRLFVALSIPRHLPAIHAQSRWHSEPLRLLSLTAQTFLPNPKGLPALVKDLQALIHRYMCLRTPPCIVLCDVGPIPGLDNPESKMTQLNGFTDSHAASDTLALPTPGEAAEYQRQQEQQQRSSKTVKDPVPQLSYIRNLQCRQPPRTTLEKFGAGYQDYLQGPLQPLAENLESVTYEVFEDDLIKYNLYEQAIRKALIDLQRSKSVSSPSGRVVVAVVGAGRGPLVTRALRASEDMAVDIELWAVEKNPNAFVLLQRHNEISWGGQVNLVQSDMRSWKGPSLASLPPNHSLQHRQNLSQPDTYPIDILISELLGSFADNELSPECLDGITHLLNPSHGISIPASYTSYLTPIAAPKLHADILARTPSDGTAPNTPYVVWLHAMDYLSTTASETSPTMKAEPVVLETWNFRHGPMEKKIEGSSENKHNARCARLTFPTPHRGACHGLAGYFEAVLYDDVEMSTHPLRMANKSPDMMSWFPIFFPLKTPLYTPDDSLLTVTIRRVTDNRKVWYEWMVESFLQPALASDVEEWKRDSIKSEKIMGKKKIRLGSSEVGSSRETGCMM